VERSKFEGYMTPNEDACQKYVWLKL